MIPLPLQHDGRLLPGGCRVRRADYSEIRVQAPGGAHSSRSRNQTGKRQGDAPSRRSRPGRLQRLHGPQRQPGEESGTLSTKTRAGKTTGAKAWSIRADQERRTPGRRGAPSLGFAQPPPYRDSARQGKQRRQEGETPPQELESTERRLPCPLKADGCGSPRSRYTRCRHVAGRAGSAAEDGRSRLSPLPPWISIEDSTSPLLPPLEAHGGFPIGATVPLSHPPLTARHSPCPARRESELHFPHAPASRHRVNGSAGVGAWEPPFDTIGTRTVTCQTREVSP